MKKAWIPAILIAAALLGSAAYVHFHHAPPAAAKDAQAESKPAADEAPPVAGHVKLTADQIKNAQLQLDAIAPGTYAPQLTLMGLLQEDPDAGFTLRAPVAGTLKTSDKPWPSLGQAMEANASIGAIEQRVVPADQIAVLSQRSTLQTQLASAQSELASATAAVEASRASYERLKALNAQDQNVSTRAVEDALAKLKGDEARLAGAKQTRDIAGKSLESLTIQLGAVPLVMNTPGRVVEVFARPGESAEPGQQILRVTDPSKMLAALNLPGPDRPPADAAEARIFIPGRTDALTAQLLPGAGTVDPKTRQEILLARVTFAATDKPAAPGTPITATITAPGQPLQGFIVPRSAIVRYQGKAWVYVAAQEEDTFNRTEASLDHPLPDGSGFFVNQGFKGDERLVTTGAATLLSSELIALGG